jgi:hypothetical protein
VTGRFGRIDPIHPTQGLRMLHRSSLTLATAMLLAQPASGAVDLTPTEARWLAAAVPVLAFARAQQLPLDIVVRPQATPGDTPLGMAFVDGRCKLVLAMRGNPEAQATLDRIDPGLVEPVVEAIAAHELAHCWRHVQHTWGSLPSGISEFSGNHRVTPEQTELLKDMWRTRREEGYADLVGLAWTLQHHPTHYESVHTWNVGLRARQVVLTGPHDTRKWVNLAQDRAAFRPAASIFEQVEGLWAAGLRQGL